MKQNKLWMVVAAAMTCSAIGAQTRSEAALEALAGQWLRTDSVRRLEIPITPLAVATRAGQAEAAYAVYAPVSGSGYVVLATAEDQTPVLGFSETGIYDARTAPPAMTQWLEGTANRVSTHLTRSAVDTLTAVSPLLGRIAYGQDAPYNGRCPWIGEQRALTGCVATAMAEMMAYYRYPEQMVGDSIQYMVDSTGVTVSWDPATTSFRWDDIRSTYSQAYTPYEGIDSLGTTENFGAVYAGYYTYGSYLVIVMQQLCYSGETSFSGTMQLLLTDADGTLIRPVGTADNRPSLSKYQYYSSYSYITPELSAMISSDLPDGDYRLYVGLKESGSDKWQIVQHWDNYLNVVPGTAFYVPLRKSGWTYTVNDVEFETAYSEVQASAIAEVCGACGAAALAQYDTLATGAYTENMVRAMYRNFGYDDGLQFVSNEFVPATDSVESDLLSELQAGRPVFAAGSNLSGGGHQFLIDGYQVQDSLLYFHFNWGWSGYENGYFVLNIDHHWLDGGLVNEFSYQFDYVTGMQPDDGVQAPMQLLSEAVTLSAPEFTPGQLIGFRSFEVTNPSPRTFEGVIRVYAVDEADASREYLLTTFGRTVSTLDFDRYVTYGGSARLSDSIPVGNYRVELRTLEAGQTEEVPVRMKAMSTFQVVVATGIESVRNDEALPRRTRRMTIDGRPIADGVEVHGLYIENGRVRVAGH